MISMAQLASHRADTAALQNDFCIGHDLDVRYLRTHVNVENVPDGDEYAVMNEDSTLGEKLREMVRRSGLSYDALAERAGYQGRSSVQAYFKPEYDRKYLSRTVADKLAKGFAGTEVAPEEVLALAGTPVSTNAKPFQMEGAPATSLPRDLPVYGTALAAPRDFDGKAVEQTTLNTGDIIERLPRPAALAGVSHAYGLYVQGGSMAPRFEHGETLFVTDSTKSRPARIGDDVVVYIRDCEHDDGERAAAVLVKRLVRRSASYVELEQFNPAMTFKVDADLVLRVDRIIPWGELLS